MYLLDTNLYIRAFRDAAEAEALDAFYVRHLRRTYLSAVVVHELVVGAQNRRKQAELQARLVAPFAARQRVVTPSFQTWVRAGEVCGAILRYGGHRDAIDRKSFFNDVLLAVSCREHGYVLVTDNGKDFERIKRVFAFQYTPPWP